jgi:hypothetical protein
VVQRTIENMLGEMEMSVVYVYSAVLSAQLRGHYDAQIAEDRHEHHHVEQLIL